LKDWQPLPERAPSVIRSDRPLIVRLIAFAALMALAIGGLAMVLAAYGRPYLIGAEWGFIWFSIGLAGLVFHAFSDRDVQYRRTYGMLGTVLVLMGAILRVWPFKDMGLYFLTYGVPCLSLGLIFLVAVVRYESDAFWKKFITRLFGIVGTLMAGAGFLFGTLRQNYLPGEGVLLILVGLCYLAAFISRQEPGTQKGYWTGVALGAVGLAAFAIALLRSIWGQSYLVPDGLLLMGLGLVYIVFALGICSDNVVVVLTRRELAAFFYSPIAYLVILGLSLVGWLMFGLFVGMLHERAVMEPIVARYIIHFIPVVCLIFVVPVLTMRLLSEEKRSGTLEVLLTAPVGEGSIVLSKFIASFFFFMLAMTPWGLYLVALRAIGKEPFDYRPMLSFTIAFAFSGAGFLALGLFFSSITRNQIIAAVLTFATLMGLTVVFWQTQTATPPWSDILSYISYLDLWIMSLEGQFAPRFLLFHLSLAVFFLYLTTKVLDARKWT
jgi:ABC-2 type transport system permease protein